MEGWVGKKSCDKLPGLIWKIGMLLSCPVPFSDLICFLKSKINTEIYRNILERSILSFADKFYRDINLPAGIGRVLAWPKSYTEY